MVQLDFETILVPGEEVGNSKDECLIGVFNTWKYDKWWYIGTHMLKKLMVVFDSTTQP